MLPVKGFMSLVNEEREGGRGENRGTVSHTLTHKQQGLGCIQQGLGCIPASRPSPPPSPRTSATSSARTPIRLCQCAGRWGSTGLALHA